MAKRNNGAPEPTAIPVAAPTDVDHGLGEFFDQFPRPVRVGTMDLAEVKELQARQTILKRMNEDIDHLAKARALISNEKFAFLRAIGNRVGLGPRDELTVNDEDGSINHVGTRRFVQPEPEAPEDVVATADSEAAPPPIAN